MHVFRLDADNQLEAFPILGQFLLEHDADLQVAVEHGCALSRCCAARKETEFAARFALLDDKIGVFGHAADEACLERCPAAGFAIDDHASDDGFEPAHAFKRNFGFNQGESRPGETQEIEARIEPRDDLDFSIDGFELCHHADRNAEIGQSRLAGPQAATVLKRDGNGRSRCLG